ncbi:MAG: substrate-binding domain-containing protein [Deltaproteobacteria bacterium]|nr:substrate-binding domain-containing protein [Deltaproteobacteria bacterium]
MKKILLTLASVVAIALNFAACKKSSSEMKIGFILDNMNEERYAKDKKFFEEKVASLGGSVIFASANSEIATQMNKVENMLSLGVKAIVIQPVDSNAAAVMVAAAHKEGVPVIAYDRIIFKAPVDLYITQNSFQVGVLQAEAAVKATGGKGNYIILSGAEGHSVAEAITAGVKSVLKNYPNIKIVAHQYHTGWSTELALRTTENAMTRLNNKVDAILANNSGMAHGAVQAVAEQKLTGKVFVAGADADLASVKDIVKGKQQFEVLKDIRPLAEAAAIAAVKLAKKEEVGGDAMLDNQSGKQIKVINTPVYPITVDNIQEKIIDSGFHDKNSVYGEKAL